MKKADAQSNDQFYRDCDALLRSGQVAEVRARLMTLNTSEIPRRRAERIAHLHNRAGLFMRGLEILFPILHPTLAQIEPPSAAERVTYALILIKLGSTAEALRVLEEVPNGEPSADLARAFVHQANWDYNSAIPHLESYLRAAAVPPYERAVAKVNLAAALIWSDRHAEARNLIRDLTAEARKERWTLLFKNLQELSGQLALSCSNLDEAKKVLEEAGRARYVDDSLWDLLVAKWLAFVDIRLHPADPKTRKALATVRARASLMRHWESVRECDRELAYATKDRNLVLKVYFGTPYQSYREKIVLHTKSWMGAEDFRYVHGQDGGVVVDLSTGASVDGKFSLKAGQAVHRLLCVLASDLYRPLFIGNVFSRLFPGEHFNPSSSVVRVHNLCARLRRWIAAHKLPLAIHIEEKFLMLQWTGRGDFGLLYREITANDLESADAARLNQLRDLLASRDFSVNDAAEKLCISKSSALRLLRGGVGAGKLVRSGTARYTIYRFAA